MYGYIHTDLYFPYYCMIPYCTWTKDFHFLGAPELRADEAVFITDSYLNNCIHMDKAYIKQRGRPAVCNNSLIN